MGPGSLAVSCYADDATATLRTQREAEALNRTLEEFQLVSGLEINGKKDKSHVVQWFSSL